MRYLLFLLAIISSTVFGQSLFDQYQGDYDIIKIVSINENNIATDVTENYSFRQLKVSTVSGAFGYTATIWQVEEDYQAILSEFSDSNDSCKLIEGQAAFECTGLYPEKTSFQEFVSDTTTHIFKQKLEFGNQSFNIEIHLKVRPII